MSSFKRELSHSYSRILNRTRISHSLVTTFAVINVTCLTIQNEDFFVVVDLALLCGIKLRDETKTKNGSYSCIRELNRSKSRKKSWIPFPLPLFREFKRGKWAQIKYDSSLPGPCKPMNVSKFQLYFVKQALKTALSAPTASCLRSEFQNRCSGGARGGHFLVHAPKIDVEIRPKARFWSSLPARFLLLIAGRQNRLPRGKHTMFA